MDKKGFMFVETIVMCAILMLALLYVYTTFTGLMAKEKERINYNTVGAQYRLYHFKKYLIDKNYLTETKANEISEYSLKSGATEIFNITDTILESYEISDLVFAKCSENVKDITLDNSSSPEFKTYIKTIGECTNANHYRFIGEIKVNMNNGVNTSASYNYYYGWIEYPTTL